MLELGGNINGFSDYALEIISVKKICFDPDFLKNSFSVNFESPIFIEFSILLGSDFSQILAFSKSF